MCEQNLFQNVIFAYLCRQSVTCLNCTMMSLESSMSLNIPSNLLVNAAPHSEKQTL